MKRLPNNFYLALSEIDKIKNLGSENSYKEINKNYKKISKKFQEFNCYVPDIEKTISKYKLPDQTVSKLRSVTEKRNQELYKLATKNSKLDKLSKRIAKEYAKNEKFKDWGKISEKKVTSVLKKLLKKRCSGWSGPWTMIELSGSGNIKSIELFDSKDKSYLEKELYKKCIKNSKSGKKSIDDKSCGQKV